MDAKRRAQCRRAQRRYLKTPKGMAAKSRARRQDRLRLYGLTQEQYDELLVKQNGKCAICMGNGGDEPSFHVDHDHFTEQVRGLLCRSCNLLLGYAKDSSFILNRAVQYLGGG